MSVSKCHQRLARFLSFVLVLIVGSMTAHAQTPAPGGPTLSDHIARLSIKAAQLLPYLQHEVLSHLQEWVQGIAVAVAVLVLLFSFLRLWRENAGGNSNLVFFFLRSLFFFGLVGSSVWLIGQMAATGREIAEGSEINGSAGRGLLFEFYQAQRDSFNESYEKLVMGTFTVKVDGRDFTVRPSTDTGGTFVGVLYDSEGTIKDLDKKLNDSSYTLPTLFNLLNVSRTILEAGDFWLLILGAVLVLVFKAAAPLMMAVAIDQKLAHKVSYPFVWGAGVLTLVWPAVGYFIRALAYLFGNMAMALGDSEPLYNWDYAAMYAIKSNFASPVYVVAIAAFMMTIAGGCLWISPYLAYRFSMGQVYEGVSSAMSQFAAMVIGTGVEAYSATAAASINQLAQNTQAQGSYDSQTTEARANRASGMLRNQAGFIAGKAQALSAAEATAGAARAAAQAGVSQAYTMFGSANRGIAGYNEQMAQISTQRSIKDNNTLGSRQASEANTDSQVGRKEEWSKGLNQVPIVGGPADLLRKWDSGVISYLSNGKYGAQPLTLHQRGYDASRIAYTSGVNANAAQSFTEAQRVERQTGDRMAAISMQQGKEAAGAAYAAAGTSIAGHRTALGLNNQAVQVDFTGRMSSADISQKSAVESAKLQAISMLVSRIGSKLAQDIEKGLEMRY
jgi:cytochrome c556